MGPELPDYFSLNYKEIIIEEIALNGLDGIGFKLLWGFVEKRLRSPITEKMKTRFWKFIVNCQSISLYKLKEPLPDIQIYDRLEIIEETTGNLMDPDFYLDGPYEYKPIRNEYGSCFHYYTRKLIPKDEVLCLSYEKVIAEYGDHLVMVANLDERWRALAPHIPITTLTQFTVANYCLLELIGKGRENGQMSVGKTNLIKLNKDPKLLFYNRKFLQDLDLLRVQCLTMVCSGKGMKGNLLRLKRFRQPKIQTVPKVGKLQNLLQYLLSQPDHSQTTDVIIKEGLLTPYQCKRLQKTNNIFTFEDRPVSTIMYTKKSKKPILKRKYICLSSKSDESSQSEDETIETPLKCQYKVGVNLLRQAYESFLNAGLKGLTQIELAQITGIEFYTTRIICRTFKAKNLVREFLEDKGRQRTARYIAVAATGDMDVKYAEEKNKLLKSYTKMCTKSKDKVCDETASTSKGETPNKKIKVEENYDTYENVNNINTRNMEYQVTELKVLNRHKEQINESLLNAKRKPTLKQLKFANSLLKIVREKGFISGYHTLGTLAAKEIGEQPMDNKSLKNFLQKLVFDGQLKVLKAKWPGSTQYSVFICSPDISNTDPRIKAKYKEVSIRALSKKPNKAKDLREIITRPVSQFAYPRYMKVQKLHEFLMKLVYFNNNEINSDLPPGFSSIVNIISEITVEFALGNISNMAISELSNTKINDSLLDVKLSNAPTNLCKVLLQSQSLHNSLRANLKLLAMFGLIQLIYSPSAHKIVYNSSLSFMFYVNRHARILNTSGVWPKEDIDPKSIEKCYYFNTFEDVSVYWNDVYSISTSTNIKQSVRRSTRKKLEPPSRLQNEVEINDNGQVYGDGLGPCGFDSCLFLDIPRLWHTLRVKVANMKKLSVKTKPKVKIPKIEIKKHVRTRTKKKAVPKPKEPKPDSKIVCRSRLNEKVDSGSVKWSKEEDKLIMICKAAITIISSVAQLGSLAIRNTIARDILSIHDPKKTRTLCHKRAVTLESNPALAHERECIISALRCRRYLIQKYEGLLKKLRLRYVSNLTKIINDARLPMLELVWVIINIVRKQIHIQRIPCIAMNYEDFQKNFNIVASTANKACSIYYTQDNNELATLKEGILLTVMLTFQNIVKADVASKIYDIFKQYPEIPLRNALEQLRKSGAIAAKEKIMNNQIHKFHFLDIVQFSYKISNGYQRRWLCRLNSDFIDEITKVLDMELSTSTIKGTPGVNCLLFEYVASDVLDVVSLTVPCIIGNSGSLVQEEQLSVIDIETNFKLKTGTLGWKNKSNLNKFSDLYVNMKCEEPLELLSLQAVVTEVKAQGADLEDEIILHLKCKKEDGATFQELQERCGYNKKELVNKLTDFESRNIVKRVGYSENIIVLTEFIEPWAMKSKDQKFIPTPWLKLNMKIRIDIFVKWAGIIVNKVFESPGSSIANLSANCEMLTTRGVQDMCTMLKEYGCVKMQVVTISKADLFSDEEEIPVFEDFNPYASTEAILVFPVKNSLTKYSYLRDKLLGTLT